MKVWQIIKADPMMKFIGENAQVEIMSVEGDKGLGKLTCFGVRVADVSIIEVEGALKIEVVQ